jgi:hypothetical protein
VVSVAEKIGCTPEVIRRCGPWRTAEEVEFAVLEWVDWFKPGPTPEQKRIKDLERQLRHKEKALAEAAALLVFKKKTRRCSGTRTTTRTPGAKDDPQADRRSEGGRDIATSRPPAAHG